jgi:four helix bundle protein
MAGADRFEDLISWQRMHELNIEIWKATESGRVAKDLDFCREIRDAADSADRNIAEGFGRYSPAQFVHFLDISRASALETKSLLNKGLAVGYWEDTEFRRLDSLATRGLQAVARFQRYLRSPQAKRNAERSRYRKDKNDSNDSNDSNESNDPNDSNA